MNLTKIAGLLGLLLAIVLAFVEVPYAGLALLVLGLVVGAGIAREDSVRVIVTALALGTVLSHSFDVVPEVGTYLSAIVVGVAALVGGAALALISRNIFARFKP